MVIEAEIWTNLYTIIVLFSFRVKFYELSKYIVIFALIIEKPRNTSKVHGK